VFFFLFALVLFFLDFVLFLGFRCTSQGFAENQIATSHRSALKSDSSSSSTTKSTTSQDDSVSNDIRLFESWLIDEGDLNSFSF
jgi:hypothetical protein